MYKYLIPILLFLLYNLTFSQEETLPKEIKQEEIEVIYPNTLPDSIQILLDKKDVTQEERIDALCKAMDYYILTQGSHIEDNYITELETITNNSNNTYYRALFNYYNGRNLLKSNSFSAIKCFYESIRQLHLLQHNNRNKELEIKNYIALSSFYINNDMFLDAYEVIKNGLNINNELKNPEINFKLKANLANVYTNIGFKEESFNINHQLLESIKDKGAEVDIHRSHILNNIGSFYMSILDSAIIYYDSALYFARTPDIYIILLNNLGEVYFKKNNKQQADVYFNKALNIAKQHNITILYNLTLNNIARSKMFQGEYNSAIIYANKSIDFAKDNNLLNFEKEALSIKKEILGELNNYKKFTEITKQLDIISDSIDNIKNIEGVKKAVLQEQILAKEKEFNDEIAKQKYQNKKEKISLIIIILMLVIIVVILIYIYKLSTDRKRVILNNKKIKEEALSKELEFNKKELDLRNRELTSNMLLQVKNNEILDNAIKKLSDIPIENEKGKTKLQSVINFLKYSINNKSYENFEYYFVKVHPDFFEKLLSDFPDLTQQELRISAFIKLNLPIKDIASIMNISPEAVRSAKTRIKKRLNISDSDESLTYFLSKY